MNKLELDLLEYIYNREAEIENAIECCGVAGGTSGCDPRDTLADLRAIMDGQPLPRGGA